MFFHGHAGLEHNVGLDGFAPRGVGNAHGHGVQHFGVLVQHFVYFAGVDVVAADEHHVFFAVHNVEIAVFVHIGDVAGIQPAVAQGAGRVVGVVPVAGHNLRALDDQLAGFAHGHRDTAHFHVHDLGHGIGQGQADGTVFVGAVQGGQVGDGRGLGQAEAFGYAGAGEFIDLLQILQRHGRGPGNAVINGVHVVFGQVPLLKNGNVDAGRAGENGGLVFGDALQQLQGIEAREKYGCGRQVHGQKQGGIQAVDMKVGQHGDENIFFAVGRRVQHG